MANLEIGGVPLVKKTNPWCGTSVGCNSKMILASPPPWSKRRKGKKALSPAQREVNDRFEQVASRENEPNECRDKSGMARNVCRVESIGDAMEGFSASGGRSRQYTEDRPRRRERPRRRYMEEEE